MKTNETIPSNLREDYQKLTQDDAYHIIREKDRKLTKYKFQYLQTKELYEEILAHKNSKEIIKVSVTTQNDFFGKLLEEIKIDLKRLAVPKINYDFCINAYQTKYEDFIIEETKFLPNKLESKLKNDDKGFAFKDDYQKNSSRFTPRDEISSEREEKISKSENVQNNYVYNYNNNLNWYQYNFPDVKMDYKHPINIDKLIKKSN